MLLEDDAGSLELTTLADLIVGNDSSISCYAARAVLMGGVENFCFKEVAIKGKLEENAWSSMYEPRPADVVENLRIRKRIEAEEQAKWAALKKKNR